MIKAIKNLFKRKTEIEKLEDLRKDYLGKSFTTSKSNRSLSDAYVKKANEIEKKIEKLKNEKKLVTKT